MKNPIFITGIGTDVGKTVVSAIVARALQADYWKPVQAGFSEGTDSLRIQKLLRNKNTVIHPEVYRFALPASPHISARDENIEISLEKIYNTFHSLHTGNRIVIEGAGGLMVPLNQKEFIADLIIKLNATVIIVSRNYLGSINHSLLTAAYCKQKNIPVAGWIFNEPYMHYEEEIAQWSNIPAIGSIRFAEEVNENFIDEQAALIKESLLKIL